MPTELTYFITKEKEGNHSLPVQTILQSFNKQTTQKAIDRDLTNDDNTIEGFVIIRTLLEEN